MLISLLCIHVTVFLIVFYKSTRVGKATAVEESSGEEQVAERRGLLRGVMLKSVSRAFTINRGEI